MALATGKALSSEIHCSRENLPAQVRLFPGPAPRSEFWWFSFVALLAQGVVLISCLSLIRSLKSMPSWGGFQILAVTDALIAVLLQFVIFIPMLAVGIRRLHDSDLSGWWLPTAMWLPVAACAGMRPAVGQA